MKTDYRCADSTNLLDGIDKRKEVFLCSIQSNHPRVTNHYSFLTSKVENKRMFAEHIYLYKCAYCGVSIEIISSSSFEIDHIYPRAKYSNEPNNNNLVNLALACKECNRGKREFDITNVPFLHPDKDQITKVFIRDDNFYIRIAPEYQGNIQVKKFYDDLKFGSQVKRIDYLLMKANVLLKAYPNYVFLERLINEIMKCRNLLA